MASRLAGRGVSCQLAAALDPGQYFSHHIYDEWGAAQGLKAGTIYAIAQSADGYLWIGAEKGLIRFDGLAFRLFSHSNSAAFPEGPVLGLTADSDGSLWIRFQGLSLLRYREGTFQPVVTRPTVHRHRRDSHVPWHER